MAGVLREFLANLPQVHPEKRLRDVTKTKKTLKRKAFEDVSNQRKNGRCQAKSKSEKCIDAVSLKEKRSAHPKVTSKVVTSKSEESTVKRVKCGKVSSEKTVECPKKSRKSSKIPLPVQCKEEFGTSDLDLDGLSDAVDKLLSDVPSEVINIDEGNPNYFDCPTYARDIVAYMRSLEGVFQLPNDYLAEGSELKSSTRAILVDWLIQVQSHLYLQTETLHLAVAIVDQFIARVGIKMSKLQLLGITALLIAAKYEERFAPDIEKLIHLTDNTYTFNQVIKMEIVVLTTLKFELHMPTPTVFLNRFWKVLESTQGKVSFKVESMCSYLLDLGLTDLCLTRTSASVRAAAALYLANSITKTRNPESMGCEWSKELSYYTTHTLAEILPSVQKMAKLLLKAPVSKYQGARDKYSSKSMHGAISHWNALKDNSVIYKLAVEC